MKFGRGNFVRLLCTLRAFSTVWYVEYITCQHLQLPFPLFSHILVWGSSHRGSGNGTANGIANGHGDIWSKQVYLMLCFSLCKQPCQTLPVSNNFCFSLFHSRLAITQIVHIYPPWTLVRIYFLLDRQASAWSTLFRSLLFYSFSGLTLRGYTSLPLRYIHLSFSFGYFFCF